MKPGFHDPPANGYRPTPPAAGGGGGGGGGAPRAGEGRTYRGVVWRTDTTDGPSGNVGLLSIWLFWGLFLECLKAFRSFWEGAFVACGFSFFPSSFLFLGK
jgi:hypothetical protein